MAHRTFERVQLTPELIEGFAGVFLSGRYDRPVATPQFHRTGWAAYCSPLELVGLCAPREHAKAQSLDSNVLTPTGWVRIGDLSVGDYVIGRNGLPTRVTHLHPVSEMELWRVYTKDGRSTLCNDEHLWSVYIPQNTGERLVTLPLKELLTKGFRTHKADVRSPILSAYTECRAFLPLPAPTCFFPIDEELTVPPYMLGVWLGDGHTADGRITSADPEIFNWFDCPVVKQSRAYLYKAEGFRERLKELGVLGDKHVPGLYQVASPIARLALLQGLMDTDGTLHQDGKIAYFCNTNENIIEAVVFIVRSLGGVAYVSTTKNAKGASKTSYRVSVKLPPSLCPFRLTRKARGWKGAEKMRLSIRSIEKAGKGLARCITVDAPDGLYVTDDFILTHNSTAFTFAFSMAEVCFRNSRYVIIIGSTEDMAAEQLSNIREELLDNEDLRREFGIQKLEQDSKTDIIVRCVDGHRFRLVARGAEQKIRGKMWNGMRPDLIIGDDMEDDEQVENKDRRRKFSNWFFRAARQAVGRGGRIRVHGTILHEDGFLARLRRNKTWRFLFFKAHESFDDFTGILWPAAWPEERLRQRQAELVAQGDAAGYSQEFLNDPQDNAEAYLRKGDFLPLSSADKEKPVRVIAAMDFAVSKADKANRTSITVGGLDPQNFLQYRDQRVGRWDPTEWIEEMFSVQTRWNPEVFGVEDGVIWKSVRTMVYNEMRSRGVFINIEAIPSVKDKATRGRTLQKRMRAGGCKFDQSAEWYPGFEQELLKFTGGGDALDDQFDSAALLAIVAERLGAPEEEDFLDDEEISFREQSARRRQSDGRSHVTGY